MKKRTEKYAVRNKHAVINLPTNDYSDGKDIKYGPNKRPP